MLDFADPFFLAKPENSLFLFWGQFSARDDVGLEFLNEDPDMRFGKLIVEDACPFVIIGIEGGFFHQLFFLEDQFMSTDDRAGFFASELKQAEKPSEQQGDDHNESKGNNK
jgi:hypothetical protein